MLLFSDDSEQANAYNEVNNAPYKASLSEDLIAAAASYEAAKAYDDYIAKNGQPSQLEAKGVLAGFSGAFIDRIVKTKGLDVIDAERTKRKANEQLHEASCQDY